MDNTDKIIDRVYKLIAVYNSGLLGGEKMPEDENPGLDKSSMENYMYFTLPMALNYQRNSYVLWECANRMYQNKSSRGVFDSHCVNTMPDNDLKEYLVKYKVALQQNKQPIIWKTLCNTIEDTMSGDIRNLFKNNGYSVNEIKKYIMDNKKRFPYLGGNKICNYWLYVLEQYTDIQFVDRENISVAPDTHVIQASVKLGIISLSETEQTNIQSFVAERWKMLLFQTELAPIDIHTPMWLWSRGKFKITI